MPHAKSIHSTNQNSIGSTASEVVSATGYRHRVIFALLRIGYSLSCVVCATRFVWVEAGEVFRPLWYGIFRERTGYTLRGCGLWQGRRSWCAYGGAIPGRSGLHTIAPLSRLPARPWG